MRKLLSNKVFKNFSYLTISSMLAQLLGFIVMIKLAGIFQPAEYGIFTFLIAQSLLLINVGDLGFKNIVIRTIARTPEKSKSIILTVSRIKIIAVLVLSLIYIAYNAFLGNLTVLQLVLVFGYSLLGCLANLFEIVFLGYQKMIVPSLVNLSISILWICIVFFAPDTLMQVNTLFLIYGILMLAKTILFFTIIKLQKLDAGFRADSFVTHSRELFKESLPYLNLMLMMIPIVYLSNNYLQLNSTEEEIGYFNLANKLMLPVTMVLNMALSAIFPNLSVLWEKDKEKFINRTVNGYQIFIYGSMILAFLFTIFSRDLIRLILPESYLVAVQVCQLQIWYVMLMGVNSLIGTLWGAMNNEKLIWRTAVQNAIITAPMLYIGSMYGALGLSYAYVLSFAIFELFLWVKFKKSIHLTTKSDWMMWIVVIISFLSSYYWISDIGLIWKVAMTLIFITIFLFIFMTKKKSNMLWKR